MKDVINITEKGRTGVAIQLFIEKLMEAARDGYHTDGHMLLNVGMQYSTLSAKLERALAGEEAMDKVVESVPSISIITPEVAAETSEALEEFADAVSDVFDGPIVDTIVTDSSVAAEAIVALKALTKKKPMLKWAEENGVELAEVPSTASAVKKALLAIVDPE